MLPSADATCTPLRESATSMLVWASLNLTPPATEPSNAPLLPGTRPAMPEPMPPAFFSEKMTVGVRMKSAATIWPPPILEFERSSPLPDSARSCFMFCMATPRSTTMKQLDCWIIMRIRLVGLERLYWLNACSTAS